MIKNKLLIALTFSLIPITLIWSVTTKSVNADVKVDDETPQIKKSPAFAVDPSDIPETSTKNPEVEDQLQTESEFQTQSTTSRPHHNWHSQRVTTDENSATAYCSAITWKTTNHPTDNAAKITCAIKDIGDDGDSVYAKWWLNGYDSHSLNNKEGYGKQVTRTDSMSAPNGSIDHIYFQACRSITLWADTCSETASWKIN